MTRPLYSSLTCNCGLSPPPGRDQSSSVMDAPKPGHWVSGTPNAALSGSSEVSWPEYSARRGVLAQSPPQPCSAHLAAAVTCAPSAPTSGPMPSWMRPWHSWLPDGTASGGQLGPITVCTRWVASLLITPAITSFMPSYVGRPLASRHMIASSSRFHDTQEWESCSGSLRNMRTDCAASRPSSSNPSPGVCASFSAARMLRPRALQRPTLAYMTSDPGGDATPCTERGSVRELAAGAAPWDPPSPASTARMASMVRLW
mmetsp:Transcript_32709/g.82991  ORF Transcript_32709/g.82991 Transcript_32709/m.82991 type:complete len:258 (-) Transcript_32709:524-1297(-)